MLNLVRESCKRVAESSNYVHASQQGIEEFAKLLTDEASDFGKILLNASKTHRLTEPVVFGSSSEPHSVPVSFISDEAEVNFTCVLALMQVGSGFRMPLHERKPTSTRSKGASDTMTLGVIALHEKFGNLDAFVLEKLTYSDVSKALDFNEQQQEDPIILKQLIEISLYVLTSTGNALRFSGLRSFYDLVSPFEIQGCPVERIISALCTVIPGFSDFAYHQSEETQQQQQQQQQQKVWLLKKAQLCASDLNARFSSRGRFLFNSDLNQLTGFVDNVLPAVLRAKGVLILNGELQSKIDCEKELLSGSNEEVELRACSIYACEQIVDVANKILKSKSSSPLQTITSRDLDWVLWVSGKLPYLRSIKRHICRNTPFY